MLARPAKYMQYMASIHEVHEVHGARRDYFLWRVGIHVPRVTVLQRKVGEREIERQRQEIDREIQRKERETAQSKSALLNLCQLLSTKLFFAAVLSLRSLLSLWQVAT